MSGCSWILTHVLNSTLMASVIIDIWYDQHLWRSQRTLASGVSPEKSQKSNWNFFFAALQVCDMCQMKGKHNVFQNNDWLHTMVMCQSAGECKLCFIYTILYLHWLWNTSWGELTDDILQNLMIFLHCSIGPIGSVGSIGSIGSVDLVGSIAVEFELHPLQTIEHNHKHNITSNSWFLSPLEWRLQAEEH